MTIRGDQAQYEELLRSQANLLIATGTGTRIAETGLDEQYQQADRTLRQLAKRLTLEAVFPWRTLWEWHGHYSQNLPTYAQRRETVGSQLAIALDELADSKLDLNTTVPTLADSTEVVLESLVDAEILLGKGRFSSVVDRLHTAIHGHLRWICDHAGIESETNASVTRLMRLLRDNHPSFGEPSMRDDEMRKLLLGMASMLESLNTLRNTASSAHPTEALLSEPEARLAVDAARAILNYLEVKTRSSR